MAIPQRTMILAFGPCISHFSSLLLFRRASPSIKLPQNSPRVAGRLRVGGKSWNRVRGAWNAVYVHCEQGVRRRRLASLTCRPFSLDFALVSQCAASQRPPLQGWLAMQRRARHEGFQDLRVSTKGWLRHLGTRKNAVPSGPEFLSMSTQR